MDSKKIIAAFVVAMFCVTAYACIDASGSSDAASKQYELYVEILGDDHIADDYVYVYFESEADNEKYCEAATAALAAAGYPEITLEIGKYGVSVKYDGSGNNSCWYSDTTKWVTVSKGAEDYINNTKAGVAVNNAWIDQEAYDALPESEKVYWLADAYMAGYYQKMLEVPGTTGVVKNYKVYLTIIDDNLTDFRTEMIEFKAENDCAAWIYGFNAATDALGDSIFANVKAVMYGTFLGIGYGENGNTAAWVKIGSKWTSVTDPVAQYPSGNELDFELKNGWISSEQYNTLSKDQQSLWVSDEMMPGYYQRMATGEIVDDVIDILLIAGIVVLVVVIAVIIFVIILARKKKTA